MYSAKDFGSEYIKIFLQQMICLGRYVIRGLWKDLKKKSVSEFNNIFFA